MIGDVRVDFAVGRNALIHLDGAVDAELQVGGVQSFAGGALAQLSANVYQLRWSTGRSLTITDQGDWLDWAVGLGSQDGPGSVKGLLGSNSGRASDFALPDGTVLNKPNDAEIAGVFAEAWRVRPGTSLLDDAHAASPALLVQAMAANLVPSSGIYDPGVPHQDTNALGMFAPSPLR
jgi:hypothetical protein